MPTQPLLHPLQPTRRCFIAIVPLAGGALLAACGKNNETTAPASTPAATGATPNTTTAPAAPDATSGVGGPSATNTPGSTTTGSTVSGTSSSTGGNGAGVPAQPAETVPPAPAGAGTPVSESEPQAQSLGYVTDARRADTTRFKNHQPGAMCGNCALYTAPAGAPTGPCGVFGGRQVVAPGWCSAWVKKVG